MKLLTTTEAAARLGLSGARVRQLHLDGRLKATHAGARVLLFSEAEIARFQRQPRGRPRKVKA